MCVCVCVGEGGGGGWGGGERESKLGNVFSIFHEINVMLSVLR